MSVPIEITVLPIACPEPFDIHVQFGMLVSSLLGQFFSPALSINYAAELWDNDMAEFKKQVLARHRDVDEEDADMGGL